MKRFLNIFFVALGVVFFALILAGIYLYFVDPFGIKAILNPSTESQAERGNDTNIDKNPALSPAQEKALETFGIDPATVPTSVTPEQEACFVEKLGQQRVDEIKAGDSPTAVEFYKAKSCI